MGEESKLRVHSFDELIIFNVSVDVFFFLLFHRIMDPWCGARITSSAPR